MAKRSLFFVSVIAGVLSLGAVVVALAQTPENEGAAATAKERFISKLSTKLGISGEQLKLALRETAVEIVDEEVAAERIPPERAEQLKQRIAEGKGPLHIRPHRRAHHLAHGLHALAARTIGIDLPTLRTELRSGKSIAEVAAERGTSREEVKSGMLSAIDGRLSERVSSGKLTPEQKEARLVKLNQVIDKLLDRKPTP